jgi:glycosyltransferase involved in cell wall biosynthesis
VNERVPASIVIVLATFNPDLVFFKKQIESIIGQSYQNWFCLVTDDGSEPEKFELISRILAEDRRFKLIHSQKQKGSVDNFAIGLTQIETNFTDINFKYVALCDQDDIWEDSKLELMIGILADNPEVALVHSDLSLIDKDDRVIGMSCWRSEGRNLTNISYASLIYRNVITGCSAIFRREVLTTALPMVSISHPAPYHHDVWLGLHALIWGNIYSLDKPLVRYRQHASNIVGAQQSAGLYDFLKKFFCWSKLSEKSKKAFGVRRKLATDFLNSIKRRGIQTIGAAKVVVDAEVDNANSIRMVGHEQIYVFTEPINFYKLLQFSFLIFRLSHLNLSLLKNGLQIAFGQFLFFLSKTNSASEEKES